QQSPVTVMTNWLENGADEGFTLDADCELKAPGDEGAVIRCRRQDLNAEEIRNHLAAGKLVTQLALSWADRVSFVLTDKLQIKRLAMLDLLQDQLKDTDAGSADLLFDATLTLLVGELRGLMTDLV
ncbi:recombination-associated protein RdgC, partial [Parachitinimonas caeni]